MAKRSAPRASNNGARPKRETWRDWMPAGAPEPDQLLTRDELIASLQAISDQAFRAAGLPLISPIEDLAITENELRHLEARGVLPRPIRQQHQGAVRAVYPPWVLFLIAAVRGQQANGYSLDEVQAWARTHGAAYALAVQNDDPNGPALLPPKRPDVAVLATNLRREIDRLARWHTKMTGVPTATVEIRVTDANGKTYPYPVTIESSEI